MKKFLSLMMICIIVFLSSVKAYADEPSFSPSDKEEVVYGILNYDGSVKNLYVVNIFDGGYITDYGNYEKVKNLSGIEPIEISGDMITANTKADKFSYQGYLASKDLPWNINIKYFIDDKEISGNDLAGMNGKLKITISVTRNSNIESIFYDNFGLQIALVLNSSLCSNIKADKASVAEAGGKKQINFTVLPGNDFEGTVTADVKNFEMEAISVNAIRLNLDLDIDTSGYLDQFSELIKGIEEVDDGAGKLLDGLKELSDGSDEYTKGLKAFTDGINQVPAGTEDIYKGAVSLSMGLSELAKQNDSINKGADTLMQSAFDAVNAQISGMGLKLPELTPENYSDVLSAIPDFQMIKLQLDGAVQFIEGLKAFTDTVAMLKSGADELSFGTQKLIESVSEMTSSANAVYDGAAGINSGIKALYDRMANYKKGTGEFRSKTSDLDSNIGEGIGDLLEEMLGSQKEIKSFVSDKNTRIVSLQFALRTEPVEITQVPAIETAEPVKLTFWQKLLKLFGLYNL